MEVQSVLFRPFSNRAAARFIMTIVAVTGVLGASPVMAQTVPQQGGNIYAAADLVPQGVEPDPHVAGSSATFESIGQSGTPGTRVTVVLLNLQPNAQYAVEIRDGSCEGTALYTLQPVSTDASGSGRSVTDITASVEFGRWHVAARVSGQGEGSVLLCGQANPALAGPPSSIPPGTTPGMPRTGQQLDLMILGTLLLAGAGLATAAGLYLRTRLARNS